MNNEKYDKFVDMLVERYNAIWAAIILEDGDVPAYRAYDEKLNERFLRSTRSFYWTMMSMGDMADMPDLDGKFLEVIWTEKYYYNYLYMFRLENEILMLGTEKKIEEFMIRLISDMDPSNGAHIPGLVGFGIGDYEGNTVETYMDMQAIEEMGGDEYEEEEVKKIFEETTRIIFERFIFMGESGFGEGKYMEVGWKNVTGWMFPYKEMVAAAVFTTDKVDSIINVMSYILKHVDG